MSGPSIGQPYQTGDFGLKFSIGDPDSNTFDSPAYAGVVVTSMEAPGTYEEPTFILDDGEQFKLTTYLKRVRNILGTAVNNAVVEHHIQNISTGVTTDYASGPTAAVADPPGAASPAPAQTQWYKAETGTIGPLAAGTYRVLTHVHGGAGDEELLAAFHEFMLMVT